jgi:hypothetical protein
MFKEGLSDWQVELIMELFKEAPGMLESLADIAEEQHIAAGSCRPGRSSVSQWGLKMC